MYHTLSRPPDGRAILRDLDRGVPAGHTTHPIGRAAESAVHALLGILRSCGNDDNPFARHNDRRLRKTDSAFVLSGLPGLCDCPPRRTGTTGGPGLPDPGGRAPAAPARERR